MRRPGNLDRLQRLVAADAVLGMDDEIAGLKARRFGDEFVETAPPARCPRQPVAKDVLLAEQHQRCVRKALFERQDGQPDSCLWQPGESAAVGDPAQLADPVLLEHNGETIG